MRVLVCGDRNWYDQALIDTALDALHASSKGPISVIIEGEARGADKMGRSWAERRNVLCLPFPADWRRYGKAAGHVRNKQQFDEGKPDLVLAFHDDIAGSKGTKHMVNYAKSQGCLTQICTH